MDYLTWLLTSNDEAWAEEEAADPAILLPRRGHGASRSAQAQREETEPGALAAVRDRLRRRRTDAARAEAQETLPEAVRRRAEQAQILRRRAEQTSPSSTELRRTGADGSPSVFSTAMERPTAEADGGVSMEDISRFFERDARRYG